MNTKKIDRKSTLMIAHRGLSGLEKENSLAAFIAAGNRSYYGVETDIHRTGDGKFILIHDSDPNRVSGTSCVVENTDFDTLRNIHLKDIDGSDNRIDLHLPTLEEYVNTCKRYGKKCILELKNECTEEELVRMIDEIKALDYFDNVIFISFHIKNLILLRSIYPKHPAQYLFCNFSDEVWEMLIKYNLDIDVAESALTEEIVDKAHSLGIKVNCWTVNNPENGQKYVDWGVDFITTNILE